MAYVNYSQYTGLGYDAISETAFPRWEAKAENEARRRILNKASPFILSVDESSDYNENNPTYWAEQNQRGICEIADAFYLLDKALSDGEPGPAVKSFSNQNYSESYASQIETQKSSSIAIDGLFLANFTRAQLSRRAGC